MDLTMRGIKNEARRRILEARVRPVWATLLFWILAALLLLLILKLTGYLDFLITVYRNFQTEINLRAGALSELGQTELYVAMTLILEELLLQTPYPAVAPLGYVLAAAVALMLAVLHTGHTYLCLQTARREIPRYRDLFEGFRVFFRICGVLLLRAALVTAGLLLFFVPGLYLWYRYRFAVYVLFDSPELGPVACLREAARRSAGYRWKLLGLDLSFLLWYIVSYLTMVFLSVPVLELWVHPFRQISRCVLYDRISGRVPEPDPEPEPPVSGGEE